MRTRQYDLLFPFPNPPLRKVLRRSAQRMTLHPRTAQDKDDGARKCNDDSDKDKDDVACDVTEEESECSGVIGVYSASISKSKTRRLISSAAIVLIPTKNSIN